MVGSKNMVVAGETVAIPVNLAQARQSGIRPNSFYARGRPGDPLNVLSEQTTRPGERGLA